jgi:hypothetical protein
MAERIPWSWFTCTYKVFFIAVGRRGGPKAICEQFPAVLRAQLQTCVNKVTSYFSCFSIKTYKHIDTLNMILLDAKRCQN